MKAGFNRNHAHRNWPLPRKTSLRRCIYKFTPTARIISFSSAKLHIFKISSPPISGDTPLDLHFTGRIRHHFAYISIMFSYSFFWLSYLSFSKNMKSCFLVYCWFQLLCIYNMSGCFERFVPFVELILEIVSWPAWEIVSGHCWRPVSARCSQK